MITAATSGDIISALQDILNAASPSVYIAFVIMASFAVVMGVRRLLTFS